ncbi:MAG: aldehyde dehydrogenase family protein, partial [Chthoniobacterales bacterium]
MQSFCGSSAHQFRERAAGLNAAADLLESAKDSWARIMTLEMGKPIRAAREEIAKCAAGCRYYASHAEEMLAPQNAATSSGR